MSLDNLLDRGFGVCLLAESHLGCSGVDNVVEQLEKYRRQQDIHNKTMPCGSSLRQWLMRGIQSEWLRR